MLIKVEKNFPRKCCDECGVSLDTRESVWIESHNTMNNIILCKECAKELKEILSLRIK